MWSRRLARIASGGIRDRDRRRTRGAGTRGRDVEITASGLPPFARLEGTTLIVTAPVVTSVRVYGVELVLTARGFTYARRSVLLYVRP